MMEINVWRYVFTNHKTPRLALISSFIISMTNFELRAGKIHYRHIEHGKYQQENPHLCSPGFTINQTKFPRKKNAGGHCTQH